VSCTGCPAAPAVRLRAAGVTASEKSGCAGGGGAGAATVMANDAVCVRLPDVAVNVAVEDPAAVPSGAVRVRVAAVPGVRVMGEGCAVTPAGKLVMVTGTLAENPFCAVASSDTVAGVPLAVKFTVAGVALSEKLGVVVAVAA
jgi:hypothetical protein